MPINLDDLALDESKCIARHNGGEAEITYRPGHLTQANLSKMDSADEGGDDTEGFFKMLSELIVEWDITTGKGKSQRKIPVTLEAMNNVPLPLLKSILKAIMEDASSGEAESSSSDG